jgi:hypothetical protein
MPRRRWIILGVVAGLVIALAVALGQGLWWYAGFRERLRLAEKHAPVVRRVLASDGRFSEIRVEAFTAHNGCLLVSAVAEPGSSNDLKRLVESTSPPVPVDYDLYEVKGTATRPGR